MPPNALTLKQRLAALSLAPSSPTSPNPMDSSSPRSPTFVSKRPNFKAFNSFNAPWTKKHHHHTVENGGVYLDSEVHAVQEVMTRMIYQAGVDFETRPMVVLNASALPDPQNVSYDLLLSRVLAYLNLYVESDYTVVFFAAGGKHTPGWNWVWKAYRSLSRKYRKNLKQLYIVHSSFFTKMLFSLAGAIISPKFFRKLTYINTLSELAEHVPLTQIDVPPAVYQENSKHENKIILPVPSRSNIFGVPLSELMGFDGEKGTVPRVVKDSVMFLREYGLEEDGIFRRSPHSSMLRAAQDAYDRGNVVSLETFGDPHLAAVLLKKYLRDLPEPVFTENLYPLIRRCPPPSSDNDMSSIMYIRETLLPELVPCAYILLSHVLHLMHEVSLRSDLNRMDAHNLAVVLCPNLVKGSNPARDMMMCAVPGGPTLFQPNDAPPPSTNSYPEGKTTLGMVIKLCIQRYYEIFDEVRDRSEAVLPRQHHTTTTADSRSEVSSSVSGRQDDEEDIDDTMLVMPIGPGHRNNNSVQLQLHRGSDGVPVSRSPPSAWACASASSQPKSALQGYNTQTFVRSMQNTFGDNASVSGPVGMTGTAQYNVYQPKGKAKSMISIEGGSGTLRGGGGRKGSISIGRGTTKKSAGAGVEALGVTAEGFFSPPRNAPPVPQLRTGNGVAAAQPP